MRADRTRWGHHNYTRRIVRVRVYEYRKRKRRMKSNEIEFRRGGRKRKRAGARKIDETKRERLMGDFFEPFMGRRRRRRRRTRTLAVPPWLMIIHVASPRRGLTFLTRSKWFACCEFDGGDRADRAIWISRLATSSSECRSSPACRFYCDGTSVRRETSRKPIVDRTSRAVLSRIRRSKTIRAAVFNCVVLPPVAVYGPPTFIVCRRHGYISGTSNLRPPNDFTVTVVSENYAVVVRPWTISTGVAPDSI